MSLRTAKDLIVSIAIVLLLITGMREMGTLKGFFYFEVDRIMARLHPQPEVLGTYDIKGELKQGCFFIFFPDDEPRQNIQNSGTHQGKVILAITNVMDVKPRFVYISADDDPLYRQGNYKFYVDPDEKVLVLEPKGFNVDKDHFVCP